MNPINYILTYKFFQDNLKFLLSYFHSRGGFNNNPNVAQFRYLITKLFLRNSTTNSNESDVITLKASSFVSLFALSNKGKRRKCHQKCYYYKFKVDDT